LSPEIILLLLRLALVAVLYTFLATALWLLWRDLRVAPAISQQKGSSPARLVVVKGDSADLWPGEELPLEPLTTLGRDQNNTIVLADTFASAWHARLARRDGGWWLEDLGSRNGTLLNELPIHGAVPLTAGDIIAIGRTEFRIEI
jgi:hypothetical protein